MSSEACSAGEEIFAIGYASVACTFTLIIVYYIFRLCYLSTTVQNRPSAWLFYSSIFYVLITVFILADCIVYGLSRCGHIHVHEATAELLYTVILRDLYVIQLYFLWIVLMIRLYFMLDGTAYALSTLSVRIYCVLFIFAPILTIFLSVPWLYTVFVVLGLSGGIFITLSVIIVYIFKLVQVYTHYADYQPQHTNNNNTKTGGTHAHAHDVDLLIAVTKDTILVLVCTALSLFILFILILNFIFSVYAVEYAAQQQLLDVALLLDAFVTAICVLFQSRFLYASYAYFCGCVDNVCHYYCNRFVNPSMDDAHAYYYYGANLQSIEEEAQQRGTNRYSMSLGTGGGAGAGGTGGTHAQPANRRGMFAPIVEEEEDEEQEMAAMMHHHHHRQHNDGMDGDDDDDVKSPELESLPSLPGGKAVVSPTKTRSGQSSGAANGAYLGVPSQSRGVTPNRGSAGVSPQSRKSHEYMLTPYLINYDGIALDKVDQRDIPQMLMNQDSNRIHGVLTKSGFQDHYTKRALAVYEKHYGTEYDIRVIRELIYRLTIKDKLKELKLVQNLYQSREVVEEILLGLNFDLHYASIALTMYEVMAEMFELDKHHQNIYDLELVTEMIMRLRAKDRERGVLFEDGDNLVLNHHRGTTDDDENVRRSQQITNAPRRHDMHTHDTHGAHYGHAYHDNPQQQPRNQQYEEHAIVTNHGDFEQGGFEHPPVQRVDSNKLLGIVRDSGHKNQSSLADDVLEVTVNTNDMDVDGEYSEHGSDYMQVMMPNNMPIQQQQQQQQQQQPRQQHQHQQQVEKQQQAQRQHLPPPPPHQQKSKPPNGHQFSSASSQDRSHAHKSQDRSHSQSASPSPSPVQNNQNIAKMANNGRRSKSNTPNGDQDNTQIAAAAEASSKQEGDVGYEVYVAYTTLYGAPLSAQALLKFARKRGQALSTRQAQQIMVQYSNPINNNHHNHNLAQSPRNPHSATNASSSNNSGTLTRTTRTSDDLRKLSKIQQRVHDDIYNVRDANGNMNDDMDDMDERDEQMMMDSDADEVTTVDTEQPLEPDQFDGADGDGDGLKSAAEMYKAAKSKQQNYLPAIPQIAPNKQQVIMSVVADGGGGREAAGNGGIHNQRSESSEREYEEEFYDEEDDEKQMKIAMMDKNHTHSYEPHRSTPPDHVEDDDEDGWSESSNDIPNAQAAASRAYYHQQNGNAKAMKVQQK